MQKCKIGSNVLQEASCIESNSLTKKYKNFEKLNNMKFHLLFLFLLLALVSSSCSNNQSNTDWEIFNLNGKVKSIIMNKTYYTDQKSSSKVPRFNYRSGDRSEITFNRDGNKIEEETYGSNDSLTCLLYT